MSSPQDEHEARVARVSRRRLLIAAGGAAAAGAAAGGGLLLDKSNGSPAAGTSSAAAAEPFLGAHQSGIATPAQGFLHFAAFDVTTSSRTDLTALLQAWTAAAERMTQGDTLNSEAGALLAPPVDTGEALGLGTARLTLTFGFGPSLFSKDGEDRFGIEALRPEALVEIPPFVRDQLQPERSGGDLCVQACADDPQVAFHAVRNLARIGRGSVVMRWSQLGFNRIPGSSAQPETTRNLMGFKDGTNNINTRDAALMAKHVWVGDERPAWMQGGSYMVSRRIRMTIEHWDRTSLGVQESTIGRNKLTGAPLSGTKEFDAADMTAVDEKGQLKVPLNAHIRLASPSANQDVSILRRGFSFTDGLDASGEIDAGLFFIAFQRDARRQFIPIQRRLSVQDVLNQYITHTSSAIFACPPGLATNEWLGQALFQG